MGIIVTLLLSQQHSSKYIFFAREALGNVVRGCINSGTMSKMSTSVGIKA
jgi:hypothetical protein